MKPPKVAKTANELVIRWSRKIPFVNRVDTNYIQAMLDRLIVGYYQYEVQAQKGNRIGDRNALKRLKEKLAKYEETGNTELLVDVGNYAMFEFGNPSIKGAKYRPLDEKSRQSPMVFFRDRTDEEGRVLEG